MIAQEQIRQYLEALAEQYPDVVIGRLGKGSVVQRGKGLSYEIDDPDIDRRLGDFPEDAVPYGPIHRTLRSALYHQGVILRPYDGSSRIPFSRAYNAGIGECLEKAILVQLSAQRGRDAFLLIGCLAEDGEVGVGSHAFNVVFMDGKPFLVDAQNPLTEDSEGRITHPYIAPIQGIDGEYEEFIVPEEWKQGRTYSL